MKQIGTRICLLDLSEKLGKGGGSPRRGPSDANGRFILELIARIIEPLGRPDAYRSIYEFLLTSWTNVGESRIKISYLLRIPYELF